MILRFEQWLVDQQDREDVVGMFARVPAMQNALQKPSRRRFDEHKNWADIVISLALPGHVDAFNAAWQEFLLAKQSAKENVEAPVPECPPGTGTGMEKKR